MVATEAFQSASRCAPAQREKFVRERLVVEHENGRIEDLGAVEVAFGAAGRLQWRRGDRGRIGAAAVSDRDPLARPLAVAMRDGGRQYWYFGAHAQARMAAHRFNQHRLDGRTANAL